VPVCVFPHLCPPLFALAAGPLTDRRFDLVHAHVKQTLDDFAGVSKPLLEIGVGAATYARIKEDICERLLDRLPPLLLSLESYADRALDMEQTIREKMAALPPEEFESLLHPVFAEDEWKLVLMGGVLGVVIGFAQIHILGAKADHSDRPQPAATSRRRRVARLLLHCHGLPHARRRRSQRFS